MNNAYQFQLQRYLEKANNAPSPYLYRAYVAHLYGTTVEFRYACMHNNLYGGPKGHGQELAKSLEDACMVILSAPQFMFPNKRVTDAAITLNNWMSAMQI